MSNQPFEIEPLPGVGGSYLLDEATGQWVVQQQTSDSSAADADTVTPDTDGTNSETPPAGED